MKQFVDVIKSIGAGTKKLTCFLLVPHRGSLRSRTGSLGCRAGRVACSIKAHRNPAHGLGPCAARTPSECKIKGLKNRQPSPPASLTRWCWPVSVHHHRIGVQAHDTCAQRSIFFFILVILAGDGRKPNSSNATPRGAALTSVDEARAGRARSP
jgi:hypothetical protein